MRQTEPLLISLPLLLAARSNALSLRARAAAVAVRNGAASANSYGVARDDERRRQLTALEFVGGRFDAIQQVVNKFGVVACGYDLFGRSLLFKVHLQYGINLFVRRQSLLVKLSGRKLRTWFLLYYGVRNYLALPVVMAR